MASEKIIHIDDSNFDEQLPGVDTPVLVDFWAAGLGGLDLNVRPRKAQVYVDGQKLGKAGSFEGYPDYLWLEKGTHQLALCRDGYLTVVQEFTILPGAIQEVKFHLARGKSVPPDELAAQLGETGTDKPDRYCQVDRNPVGRPPRGWGQARARTLHIVSRFRDRVPT